MTAGASIWFENWGVVNPGWKTGVCVVVPRNSEDGGT